MATPGLNLATIDPARLTAATVEGIAGLDDIRRAILDELVEGSDGFYYQLALDGDTVTIRLAGFRVAKVPLAQLLRRPRVDA